MTRTLRPRRPSILSRSCPAERQLSEEISWTEGGWIDTRDAVKLVEAATGADMGSKLAEWAMADLLPSRCKRVVTIDNAGLTVNRDPSAMVMPAFWRAWSATYRNFWQAGPEAQAKRQLSEWSLGHFETSEAAGRCCAYGMQFHGPSLRELLGLPEAAAEASRGDMPTVDAPAAPPAREPAKGGRSKPTWFDAFAEIYDDQWALKCKADDEGREPPPWPTDEAFLRAVLRKQPTSNAKISALRYHRRVLDRGSGRRA